MIRRRSLRRRFIIERALIVTGSEVEVSVGPRERERELGMYGMR